MPSLLPPQLCGPCHRTKGLSGLPSMAIPSMPQLDQAGGVYGLCDGHNGKEHSTRLDYLGEPFSDEKKATYEATKTKWNEDVKSGWTFISDIGQTPSKV